MPLIFFSWTYVRFHLSSKWPCLADSAFGFEVFIVRSDPRAHWSGVSPKLTHPLFCNGERAFMIQQSCSAL